MDEERRERNRKKARKWRAKNLEKAREATRRWQEANRERKRANDAAWREAHRDELRRKARERYYRLKGVSPEGRPVRDEAAIEAWRAEFAGRWAELADKLGPEGFLSRLAALMRKERRR